MRQAQLCHLGSEIGLNFLEVPVIGEGNDYGVEGLCVTLRMSGGPRGLESVPDIQPEDAPSIARVYVFSIVNAEGSRTSRPYIYNSAFRIKGENTALGA